MAEIDDLIVKIGADVSELTTAMKKVEKNADDAGKKVNDEFKKTKGGFNAAIDGAKALAVAVAAAAAAFKVAEKLVQSFAGARTLGKLAKGLQVSTEEFSKLNNLTLSLGGETEDLADTIKDLNERIADAAANGGEYDEVLQSMGLSSQELAKSTPTEQLTKFFSALQNVNDAGKENFIVNTLAGDAGFRLAGAFNEIEGSVSDAAEEMAKMIAPLTDLENAAVSKISKDFALIGIQVDSLSTKLSVGFGAAINVASDAFSTFGSDIQDSIPDLETFAGVGAKAFIGLRILIENVNARLEFTRGAFLKVSAGAIGMAASIQAATGSSSEFLKNMAAEVHKEADAALKESSKSAMDMLDLLTSFGEEAKAKQMQFMEEIRITAQEEGEESLKQRTLYEELFTKEQLKQMEIRRKMGKGNFAQQMKDAGNFFNAVSVLMNTNSRKQFEIGKAAAIGGAIVDTYKAATGAYSALSSIPIVGPALGAVAAAAAVAAGLANVNAIKSQTFGGGGSAAPASAGGGGGVAAAQVPSQEPAPVQNVTQANISLVGDNFGQQEVRNLITEINGATDDNAQITVN